MTAYVVLANLGSAQLFETRVMGIVFDKALAENCKIDSEKGLAHYGGGVTVSIHDYELNESFAKQIASALS